MSDESKPRRETVQWTLREQEEINVEALALAESDDPEAARHARRVFAFLARRARGV